MVGLAGPQGKTHPWYVGRWWTTGVEGCADVLLVGVVSTLLSFVLVGGLATRGVVTTIGPAG